MIRAVSLGAAVLVNPADDVRDAAVPGVAELGPCHLSKAPQGLPLLRAESRSNQHPAAPAGLSIAQTLLLQHSNCISQAVLHTTSSYARAWLPKQVHRFLCWGKVAFGR